MAFTRPVLSLAFTLSEIGKNFDTLFFIGLIPENYLNTIFNVTYEIEKYITRPYASVHFKNGPHAKND